VKTVAAHTSLSCFRRFHTLRCWPSS